MDTSSSSETGESSKDSRKDNRETIRKKQREGLNEAFGDLFLKISVPEVARKYSAEADKAAHDLAERLRALSASSQESLQSQNEDQPRKYVETREKLMGDAAFCLKKGKVVLKSLRADKVLDKPSFKRAYKELDDGDQALLQERATLAANRVKIRYGILSHPTHARIGEAYLAAIAENLPDPSGKKQGTGDNFEQTSFRRRLFVTYNLPDYDCDPANLECWCPVSRRNWLEEDMVEAHIVPYSIGEINAAYLFGLDLEKGYEAVWSIQNGLLLHNKIEKALNAARIIIVPDEDDLNELKLVILDETLLDQKVDVGGPTYRDLNNRRLNFQTKARPGQRFLYLHCILALFRRRRFHVVGWENDKTKVTTSYTWGTPGPWIRRSIIKALAFEVGDAERVEDLISDKNCLTDFPGELSKEKEADMAVKIRQEFQEKMEF